MRFRSTVTSAIYFCLLLGCGQVEVNSKDLETAPDFSLTTVDGNFLSLSEYRGKVVLIDFWATWCPPCREEVPGFVDLYNRYHAKGLEIIGVSLDDGGPAVVREFMKEYGVNYSVVMGTSQVTRAYGGIRALPTTFLVDHRGKIVKKYIGGYPASQFEADITQVLNNLLTSP